MGATFFFHFSHLKLKLCTKIRTRQNNQTTRYRNIYHGFYRNNQAAVFHCYHIIYILNPLNCRNNLQVKNKSHNKQLNDKLALLPVCTECSSDFFFQPSKTDSWHAYQLILCHHQVRDKEKQKEERKKKKVLQFPFPVSKILFCFRMIRYLIHDFTKINLAKLIYVKL